MMAGVTYGDPWDPANLQGPLISAKQRDRVMGYIEKGKAEGARLVRRRRPRPPPQGLLRRAHPVRRRRPQGHHRPGGDLRPRACVIAFEDDDDAVRIANDSIYGLSGAVTSASEERAMAVARRVRTGTLMVNGGFWNAPDVPFGGYRQSGVGRENGVEGFEEYLETKALALSRERRLVLSGAAALDGARLRSSIWLSRARGWRCRWRRSSRRWR